MVNIKISKKSRQAINLVRDAFEDLKTQDDAIKYMYEMMREKSTLPPIFEVINDGKIQQDS